MTNPGLMVFNFCKSGEFHDQNTGLFLTAKGQHLSLSAHHLSLLYIPGRSNWNPGQRLHLVTRTQHAKPTKIGEDWVRVTQSKPQKQRNEYFCRRKKIHLQKVIFLFGKNGVEQSFHSLCLLKNLFQCF